MSRNRLADQTSPYLIQHADNPVDWYPWGDEALAKAKRENKPILLSVGYAACHWCHVMAHECFERPDIAELMNELYVNIKVDREERPDLDMIYQQALGLLGEHGGWPLTMFCTPDAEPYWGGTYFPPEPMFGRPAFPAVLRQLALAHSEEPDKVEKNVSAVLAALKQLSSPAGGGGVADGVVERVAEHLGGEIDAIHGGIRGAPKFPQAPLLKMMLRGYRLGHNTRLRDLVTLSLDRMAQGGIYDHLGGGFARYSVDAQWLAPHFEKMLYDNAQLIELYTQAWHATRKPLYSQRVSETVEWLLRDMFNPDAPAFCATLDADSEAEEGKYYVWNEAEIDELLGTDAAAFKAAYDVTKNGNWEGKTILNRSSNPELGDDATEAALADCRARLLAARQLRVAPARDDKVLADWNGLMIAALAEASQVFQRPDWLRAAEAAFAFIVEAMTDGDRLCHVWRAGKRQNVAMVDDYASLMRAALLMHEASGDPNLIVQAQAWAQVVDRCYWDDGGGGYFMTADDAVDVIIRTKSATDQATPSGNGLMVEALARLYYLTGEDRYRDRAEATVRAFSGEFSRNFMPMTTLLAANDFLNHAVQIVIVGQRDRAEMEAMRRIAYSLFQPNRVVQIVAPDDELPDSHPAAGKGMIDGAVTAYVCVGPVCSLPSTDPAALSTELETH